MSQGSANKQVIITDTSCFILLDKIDSLEVLRLIYDQVMTTPEIAAEFIRPLPEWITIVRVNAAHLVAEYAKYVDLGEASAIALWQETQDALLIIDDFKGRRLANQLKVKFTGTIGILIIARQQNFIASLRPYFDLIKSTNFRIDHMLLDRILLDFND